MAALVNANEIMQFCNFVTRSVCIFECKAHLSAESQIETD